MENPFRRKPSLPDAITLIDPNAVGTKAIVTFLKHKRGISMDLIDTSVKSGDQKDETYEFKAGNHAANTDTGEEEKKPWCEIS